MQPDLDTVVRALASRMVASDPMEYLQDNDDYNDLWGMLLDVVPGLTNAIEAVIAQRA